MTMFLREQKELSGIAANKALHLTDKSAAPIVALLLSASEFCR